jgi:hypothetical protein
MLCISFAQHASHQISVWLHYKHFDFCFFEQHSFHDDLLWSRHVSVLQRNPATVGIIDAWKTSAVGGRGAVGSRSGITLPHTSRHQLMRDTQ